LDQEVEERSRIGVRSLGDLGEYYCQFIAIATFLRNKGRVLEAEQSRAFARVSNANYGLASRIACKLKFPDHFLMTHTQPIIFAKQLGSFSRYIAISTRFADYIIACDRFKLLLPSETKVNNLQNLVTAFPKLSHHFRVNCISEKDRLPHSKQNLLAATSA